jgi:DNA-directed RNA polymerase subunit RPC12/RpoP
MEQKRTYSISYRCANCGKIYTKEIQKGATADGRGGECPNCGIGDGQAGVGKFEVIRDNEQPAKHYF